MENKIENEKAMTTITNEEIKKLIYTIRGKQVMLDSDVAMLYHYETKKINQAVKRNIERFPENFCFQLTEEETLRLQFATASKNKDLRSQFVTASGKTDNRFRNKKYLPYAFTEQGIAMLSGLLKNEIAVKVSINIMDAFVEMRRFLLSNGQIFERLTTLEYKQLENEKNFDKVFNLLQDNENIRQKLFFEGQIYDAYNLIIKLIESANSKIVIIDNYVDTSILEMLTKKKQNVEVTILTSIRSNIQNIDVQKFNKQYPILKLARTDKFHDRFIIIDNTELYHCGASIKDLGKKCFAINKMESNEIIDMLKHEIKFT